MAQRSALQTTFLESFDSRSCHRFLFLRKDCHSIHNLSTVVEYRFKTTSCSYSEIFKLVSKKPKPSKYGPLRKFPRQGVTHVSCYQILERYCFRPTVRKAHSIRVQKGYFRDFRYYIIGQFSLQSNKSLNFYNYLKTITVDNFKSELGLEQ